MQSDVALGPPAGGYRPRERWVIVTSVSVLAVIIAGVVFAAGVYIGNNRELAPGTAPGFPGGPPALQAQGPQRFGQPGAAGIPGAQAPGAAGQLPGAQNGQAPAFDVVGALASAAGSSLTIITADGPRQVAVDGKTLFQQDDGGSASVPPRPNSVVAIRLRPGTTTAAVVLLITGRAPAAGPQQPVAPAPGGQRN